MRHRDFIGTATSSAILAEPKITRAKSAKVLKFRPVGDLAVLDPVWSGARPSRNHRNLVHDTLHGMDEDLAVWPRMAAGHIVEDDGRRWFITLREGWRFHDRTPVLARDVVPSVKRFCARDTSGQPEKDQRGTSAGPVGIAEHEARTTSACTGSGHDLCKTVGVDGPNHGFPCRAILKSCNRSSLPPLSLRTGTTRPPRG